MFSLPPRLSSNDSCVFCRSPATLLCSCLASSTFLCSDCLPKHTAQHPSRGHSFLSIGLRHADHSELQQKSATFAERKNSLLQNLATIDNCCDEFQSEMTKFIQECHRYVATVIDRLKDWRNTLEAEITNAVLALESNLLQQPDSSEGRFETYLRGSGPSDFVLFTYSIDFSPLYRGLSKSLTEEHSEFSLPKPLLPCLHLNILSFFDFTSLTWGPKTRLRSTIVSDLDSTYALLSPTMLVSCGCKRYSASCKSDLGKCAYLVSATGDVLMLPDMTASRSSPGVLFVKKNQTLLVFGGRGCDSGEAMLMAQTEATWMLLPRMSTPRVYFNPCLMDISVFLCGGESLSVDKYDLSTQEMTHFLSKIPEISQTITIVSDDCLNIITNTYITRLRWVGGSLREVYTKDKDLSGVRASTNPVTVRDRVVGEVAVVVYIDKCVWIAVETGRVVKRVKNS